MEQIEKRTCPFSFRFCFDCRYYPVKCLQPEINFQLIIAGGLTIAAIFMRKTPNFTAVIVSVLICRLSLFKIVRSWKYYCGKRDLQQEITFNVTRVFSVDEKRYAVELLRALILLKKNYSVLQRKVNSGRTYNLLAEIYPLIRDPILDIYPNRYSAVAYQLGKARISQPEVSALTGKLRYKLLEVSLMPQ